MFTISAEHGLVTDRQTMTVYTRASQHHADKKTKLYDLGYTYEVFQ